MLPHGTRNPSSTMLGLSRTPSRKITQDRCRTRLDLTSTSCWNSRRPRLLLPLCPIFRSPEELIVKHPWACLQSRHPTFPPSEEAQLVLMVEDVLCLRRCTATVSTHPRPHNIHRPTTGLALSRQTLPDTNGCKNPCQQDPSSGSRRANLPCSRN